MIVFPNNWKNIGLCPKIDEIQDGLIKILKKLNCNNLALSGGIDSSYILWCMLQVFGTNINCYTIALNEKHPDFIYAKKITTLFKVNWEYLLTNNKIIDLTNDYQGDGGVRTFFTWLEERVEQIICCDGIDEFMGGYYDHLHTPTHETYYNYMLRLQKEQLEPLHQNSGKIKVFLPYMDFSLISLYNRFPMSMRFGTDDRKKVIKQLACNKIPEEIINRRKYGFIDIGVIK
jgi:predicted HicB family RNase H-like nuclease